MLWDFLMRTGEDDPQLSPEGPAGHTLSASKARKWQRSVRAARALEYRMVWLTMAGTGLASCSPRATVCQEALLCLLGCSFHAAGASWDLVGLSCWAGVVEASGDSCSFTLCYGFAAPQLRCPEIPLSCSMFFPQPPWTHRTLQHSTTCVLSVLNLPRSPSSLFGTSYSLSGMPSHLNNLHVWGYDGNWEC